MRLIRMSLENFQGIRKAEFEFGGRSANIYGDNATGKTTVFNAFTWLIFGNASTGAKDYTPKTKTKGGDAHNLDHAAECELEIDGEIVTFRRVYHEVWKKTRGNAEATLSGHTTDYFINGVPKKEKEYSKYWENIFENEEIPKLLTMPFYFAETMHWEKRRSILLDICGNVSDVEIMESNEELRSLPALLGKSTVDEYKKIMRASLTEINRKIQAIPARIDEAEKAIPDTTGINPDEIEFRIQDVQELIAAAEKERAGILANDQSMSSVRMKLAELNYRLTESRREYSERQQAENAQVFEVIRDLRNKVTLLQSDLNNLKLAHRRAVAKVDGLEKKRNEIFAEHRKKQEEYKTVQGMVFDEGATVCITCGQDLPPEKASAIRESFNVNKSERLIAITTAMDMLVERGKNEASKDMLKAAQQAVTGAENAVTKAQSAVDSLVKKLQEAENNRNQTVLPPFEQTEEYKTIIAEINAAKSEEAQAEPDTSGIDRKIAMYRDEVNSLNTSKAALETEKIQRARIAELEKQEEELGKAYEEAQHYLYLCEKFARTKAKLLTEKINEQFKTVSFRLFKKNITNDGIDDICEVLIPTEEGNLVPFSLANNAARINAGIEIIGVLSEYYGVKLPLFIDNAESITRIVPTNSQIIQLIVSEIDKRLRLELVKFERSA